MKEDLTKSIDAIIDEIFAESENDKVEKSIDIAADASTTADAAVNKAPKAQDDDKRNAGRPKQISDVPAIDQDGKRDGDYDKDIKSNDGKEDEPSETNQVKEKNQVKKSEDKTDELTKSEREELEALRAEKAAKAEEMKKAEAEKAHEDLIKSIVEKTASRYEEKLEKMQKSLTEANETIQAMANKPQRAKSITNISSLEKSGTSAEKSAENFSKAEVLDAAEELYKSGQIKMEHVIEIENNGNVYDPRVKALIKKKLES